MGSNPKRKVKACERCGQLTRNVDCVCDQCGGKTYETGAMDVSQRERAVEAHVTAQVIKGKVLGLPRKKDSGSSTG